MSAINKIADENIRVFIESRELKEFMGNGESWHWGECFYDMLNGKDNIEEHIKKLSNF